MMNNDYQKILFAALKKEQKTYTILKSFQEKMAQTQ